MSFEVALNAGEKRLYVAFMNLDKSDRIPLSCENCGTELSTDTASRSILSDGQVHVFCQDCMLHMLIIKDGSLKL